MNITEDDIQLYRNQMNLIKQRMSAIKSILDKHTFTLYEQTDIEFCALQLRKVIELIMLGSLVVNADVYESKYSEIRDWKSDWNAKYICNDLARVNDKFYPQPIKVSHGTDGKVNHWERIDDECITAEKMLIVYDKIGRFMHSDNPFGSQVDYEYYEGLINDCYNEVIKLTTCHLVYFVGQVYCYYVAMTTSPEDDSVYITLFEQQL